MERRTSMASMPADYVSPSMTPIYTGLIIPMGVSWSEKSYVGPPIGTVSGSTTSSPKASQMVDDGKKLEEEKEATVKKESLGSHSSSSYVYVKSVNFNSNRTESDYDISDSRSKSSVSSSGNVISVSDFFAFVPSLENNQFEKYITEEIPTYTPMKAETSSSCVTQSNSEYQSSNESQSQSDSEADCSEESTKGSSDIASCSVEYPESLSDEEVNKIIEKQGLILQCEDHSKDETVIKVNPIHVHTTKPLPSPCNMAKVAEHLKTKETEETKMVAKFKKPFKPCFKCGQEGHLIKHCKQVDETSASSSKGDGSDGKGNKNCFFGSKSQRNKSYYSCKSQYMKAVSHDSKSRMKKDLDQRT
ncbi:hypothetical protein L1987_43154 [Smallanthus sonchifolius]|uniref:Uncharacterized protein n=1 Tax=Smallanthus sonchifolius TaxID=185202 RepID=A0ACB9GMW0_9ASTR|nr:hypothetical protein L1987_43154 [Smallanthus sonchifolius]